MIEVFYFSDRDVKRKLFDRVSEAKTLTVVTQVRHSQAMAPVHEREPFASLERAVGALVDFIVVVDEGAAQGMWRDPMGDLAEHLFPNDRDEAYAAASGYLLVENGQAKAVVRKRSSREDAWFIQEALSRIDRRLPRPDGSRRPREEVKPGREEKTPPRPSTPPAPAVAGSSDPWQLLGIAPGMSLSEARKLFHAQLAQYHPDKVAHLAEEFRALAEERTRRLLEAWMQVESQLKR